MNIIKGLLISFTKHVISFMFLTELDSESDSDLEEEVFGETGNGQDDEEPWQSLSS